MLASFDAGMKALVQHTCSLSSTYLYGVGHHPECVHNCRPIITLLPSSGSLQRNKAIYGAELKPASSRE